MILAHEFSVLIDDGQRVGVMLRISEHLAIGRPHDESGHRTQGYFDIRHPFILCEKFDITRIGGHVGSIELGVGYESEQIALG